MKQSTHVKIKTLPSALKALAVLSFVMLSSMDAKAANTCSQLFSSTSSSIPLSNEALRSKYEATNLAESLYAKTFEGGVRAYAKDFRQKKFSNAFFFITHRITTPVLNERLLLLTKRQPTPVEKKRIDVALEKIEAHKQRAPQWTEYANDKSARKRFPVDELDMIAEFNANRAPTAGDRNTPTQADVEGWNRASNYVYRLAALKANLTRERLLKIDHLINNRSQVRIWPGHLTPHTDINFVIHKKNGRNVINPLDTFIPGLSKPEMTDYFLRWLRKNIDSVHPVILAAQARQLLVSIHPFMDGNGRLARTVADFILMRGGYPPASISSSTIGEKNYGVVLFPLKSFDDQISVGDNYMFMADGVLRSYEALEGVSSH